MFKLSLSFWCKERVERTFVQIFLEIHCEQKELPHVWRPLVLLFFVNSRFAV